MAEDEAISGAAAGSLDEQVAPGEPTSPWRWWLAALAFAGGLLWPGGRSLLFDRGVELILLAIMVHLVWTRIDFSEVLQPVSAAAKRLALAFVGLFLFGHLWAVDEETFPLTHWTMYTVAPEGDLIVYEYRGLTESGELIEFLPRLRSRTLSTFLGNFDLPMRSERLWEWERQTVLLDDAPKRRAEFKELHFGSLRGLARLHNQSGGAAISAVIVTRLVLPRAQAQRPRSEARREEAWRVKVEVQ